MSANPWVSLPAAWSAPLATTFNALHHDAKTLRIVPSALSALSAVESVFPLLDKSALAQHFESALGGFAIAGALSSSLADIRTTPLDASITPEDYTGEKAPFAPFEAALARLSAKTPVGSSMRSAQWSQVPVELRNHAQFSAGVESAAFLQHISDRVADRLTAIENDPDEFVYQLRKVADDVGLPYTSAGEFGTIKDIRSLPRLRLVYETQNAMAAEYARRKADLDPEALDLYPAYELARVESRKEPRSPMFWAQRWHEAGNASGWIGASREPHIALKTSPIWLALGELGPFGNPHPPYEWGSGMGTIDVSRAEAEELGIIKKGERPAPIDEPGFNQDLGASISDIKPEIRSMLKSWLGDKVQEVDGRLLWK
jgi:hypothetical protein